jgi:hypothetical protein
MPIYESVCLTCGKEHEYIRTMANCMDTPICCGVHSDKRIMSAPMGIVDIPAYVSPVSGRLINSRAQRKDDFARTNCRPWEGLEQEKKEAARRAAYIEQKEDAALTVAAEKALAQMPAEKRKVLETI